MRIVFLITMGLERPSGVRYFQIARGLVAQGHQVRILALHPDLAHCPQHRLIQAGVEVWYVGQMHARKQGSQPQRFGPLTLLRVLVQATLGMIWGVICSPAEVYHLGKPQPVNGLAALIAICGLRRQRFYLDCDDDEVRANRLTAAWQRAVFAFWQWLLPRIAAGVTVNTRTLAATIATATRQRVVYVPNGANPEQWLAPPPQHLAALRVALGAEQRRIVAYLGTLALQNHPVDLLLEAWPMIIAAEPQALLLLVGGGEDLPSLQAWVASHGLQASVRFTGQLPRASVPALLALAEVSVDPVRADPVAAARSPLKLFESLALGIPVVTGEVGDRAELLANGQAGILVTPGSPTALAKAIISLFHDPALQHRLAMAARQQARQYTWPSLAQRWATVYDQ